MKLWFLIALVFAPLLSFSAVKLSCEVLPNKTPHKSQSFYTGFNLIVEGNQVTGQYLNGGYTYQLENDKDTYVSASAVNGIITVKVDRWIGYDNYVADMKIQNNTGVLSLMNPSIAWVNIQLSTKLFALNSKLPFSAQGLL